MAWLNILKFLAPILLFVGYGMYQHDAGWRERDATVQQEKQAASDAAVELADKKCDEQKALTSGVSHEYQINLKSANDRLADALGSLWDARRGNNQVRDLSSGAGGRDDGAGDHRLYYADERAAVTALDRAAVATRQAEQLVACQSFIRKEREQR